MQCLRDAIAEYTKALAAALVRNFFKPVHAIKGEDTDAYPKHLFDNRYETGQNTLDRIIRPASIHRSGL